MKPMKTRLFVAQRLNKADAVEVISWARAYVSHMEQLGVFKRKNRRFRKKWLKDSKLWEITVEGSGKNELPVLMAYFAGFQDSRFE